MDISRGIALKQRLASRAHKKQTEYHEVADFRSKTGSSKLSALTFRKVIVWTLEYNLISTR